MTKKSTKIIWFTGISGVGKTTLSNSFYEKFKKKFKIKKVDGDIFRKKNKTPNSFSKKNIIRNNKMIINHVDKIRQKYQIILVSVISPLAETRKLAKKRFKANYFEVFMYCNIKSLIKRDVKKLYLKAREGKLNLIGFNSPIIYEKSAYKVIKLNTDKTTIFQSIHKISKIIKINY
tara:strand:- start:9700 stop:10227 length:528 start_codon:yes stop_codon:yes gene_type:complete